MDDEKFEYLLIQRKHSIAYIDFIRGKYNIKKKSQMNMLFQSMTKTEKEKIRDEDFNKIWSEVWIKSSNNNTYFQTEYKNAKKKFEEIRNNGINTINIPLLLKINNNDNKLSWGFPKGRRQINETDINCAKREFQEETNYSYASSDYTILEDLKTIEEEFIGSNGIAYKYVYYVSRSKNKKPAYINSYNLSQISEIGNIIWVSYLDAREKLKDNRRRLSILDKLQKKLEKKYN
jgi:8-oxo-dGTP pyrophosphatase MutT (NUDIX family)